MESQLSGFVITGYFNTKTPPKVSANVIGFLYRHQGLTDWASLAEKPPAVPVGTVFHLAVGWTNQSAEAICGHIELTITSPDGSQLTLQAVENQNNWAAPDNGWWVQFEPITLDQVGPYSARATLSTMGETLDSKSPSVAEAQPPVLELNAISGQQNHVMTILNVEGIPFSSVGMEPKCSVAAFAQYLEETWGAGTEGSSQDRWVSDAQALAEAVSQIVNPCKLTEPVYQPELKQELIDAINQFPEYLTADPYHNHAQTIVEMWKAQEGSIPFAVLSSPITMSKMRGVTVSCKTFTSYGYWDEKIPNHWWDNIYCIMFFEPQFYPPKSPPAFRYIGDAPVAGETIELGPWNCFGGGHYYPGIYDAFVDIKMTGGGNPAAPVVEFRIKNAVKVTGSGTVSP